MDFDGNIEDHTGGLMDLRRGVVRFCSPGAQRITESPVRILRFFRFHALFGNGTEYDAISLSEIEEAVALHRLKMVSGEMCWQELQKIFSSGSRGVDEIVRMNEIGILTAVGFRDPDLERMKQRFFLMNLLFMSADGVKTRAGCSLPAGTGGSGCLSLQSHSGRRTFRPLDANFVFRIS